LKCSDIATDIKENIMTIIADISTHKAVKVDGKINVYLKGFSMGVHELSEETIEFEDELLYTLPLENEDDILPMFEGFKENNRINLAEANGDF
jgi:hypothetical protein